MIIILRGCVTLCAEKRMLFLFLFADSFSENIGLVRFLCSFAFFLYVRVFPCSGSARFRYFIVLFILIFLMSCRRDRLPSMN